jgi:hypothetical protein
MKMIYIFLNHIQKAPSNHPIPSMTDKEDKYEI